AHDSSKVTLTLCSHGIEFEGAASGYHRSYERVSSHQLQSRVNYPCAISALLQIQPTSVFNSGQEDLSDVCVQRLRRLVGLLRVAALVLLFLFVDRQAFAHQDSRQIQLAAAFELPQLPKVPGLPSALTGPSADWRQFDSFFTFVVKRFGDDV